MGSKNALRDTEKAQKQSKCHRRAFTWTRFGMILAVLLIADSLFIRTRAHPAKSSVPKIPIREGQEHLHNNLINHAVHIDDVNADLPFASVRHLYETHPNSVVHDAGKKAAVEDAKKVTIITREVHASNVHQSEAVGEVVPPTHKFFLGAFTGAAIRAVAGLLGLTAGNKVCSFIDDAFGDDKNGAQIFGTVACYIGATLLGLYGLFSAGHSLYKLQQAGQRAQELFDDVNEAFELYDTVAGGFNPAKFKRDAPVDVHEMMQDDKMTHHLAVYMASKGYKYEAAGLMSTIRPVAMQTVTNHTAHLWQELHEGKIRKSHVLTRINVGIIDNSFHEKRQDDTQVCENSNNEEGEDPQATLCSSGQNEGFTGVYDSFDMFQDENSYEVVDYGMGDSKYSDDVARYSGDLMKLGGTGGVCIYPSVNNQTALTILSALEVNGRPSQTYANCPSLGS